MLRRLIVTGRRVSVQRLSDMPAGLGSVRFDGRDQRGRLLPSGVYLCRVSALGRYQLHKMVIAW